MRRRPARLALLGLVAVVGLGACRRERHPVAWSWERMIRQQSSKAFEGNNLFPDSMAMRRPPEGTVPRNAPVASSAILTGHTGADTTVLVESTPDTAAAAGPLGGAVVQRIPIRLTARDLQRGRDRFRIYCSPCHGVEANGNGPVAANMTLRKPPSLVSPRVRQMADGYLFTVISQGYGFMPSYVTELDVKDRWAVVAYLRALQMAQGTPLQALPPDVQQQARSALRGGGEVRP